MVVVSASQVDLEFDLRRLPWSRSTILRAVTITELRYPRLPRGYYIPDSIEFPGSTDFKETNEPLVLHLPELHPFRLRLLRAEILGIETPWAEAASIDVTPDGLSARGVQLRMPDTDVSMMVQGDVTLDLRGQRLVGDARGQCRQHNIRPMLVALDITNSYSFIDAFTKVDPPVDASCRFDVDLRRNDLRLGLDLHPIGGCYRGVPLNRVDGKLDIRVFVRDTYQNAQITVGPLLGKLADGSAVEGRIVYENTNDVGFVDFDVGTRAPIKDVLAIANVWTDGTLNCLSVTNGVPSMTLRGRLAIDDAHADMNELRGTVAFGEGSLLGVPLRNATTVFHVRGTSVHFTDAAANFPHGGVLTGEGLISVPESRSELGTFRVKVSGEALTLADVARTFACEAGDKRGLVDGWMTLSGPLHSETNAVADLSAEGHLECRDGHLAQMRLFSGLTDYLAQHLPVVAKIVNLSRASLDFKLEKGVLSSSNVVVEGNVLSIQAEGSYDILNDNLDVRAHVTLAKNDSFLAKLATPITWPFSNLAKVLLDFRIRGTLDNPSWIYSRNPLDLLPRKK